MAILRSDTTVGGVPIANLFNDASKLTQGTLSSDRLPNTGNSGTFMFPQGNIGNACGWVAWNMNMANSISFSTTFTARSTGSLTCVFFTNTEQGYDKLNVTAAGSTIVSNASGTYYSYQTISLNTNQQIVLTYTKDTSQSRFNDVCGMANLVWTPSGSSTSYPLTSSNISSYFNISNSTGSYYFRYSFVVFTPAITTDAKGRVTSIVYAPQVLPM